MEYIYGTARRGGVTVENLKTVGTEHTELSGFFHTVRTFADGTTIEDRCRILEHYHTEEADGLCYDWYYIDSHYRLCDTATAKLQLLQERAAAEAASVAQIRTAAKQYARTAASIPDEQALAMPDLFTTWEEALEAGEALGENTILNDGGQLYRVVQPGRVTPLESQPPHGEGMLAVYRPIVQGHAGTLEDPIPFVYGMDTEQGKYYSYGGTVYLCNQTMSPCVWTPDTPGLWQWTEATDT